MPGSLLFCNSLSCFFEMKGQFVVISGFQGITSLKVLKGLLIVAEFKQSITLAISIIIFTDI